MNTVFIGGSRDISRLPEEAKKRLENIVSSKHHIIVGDAKGADTAVQKLLHANAYSSVVVYCTGERCRNNVGHWETMNISASKKDKGFNFYALKDREMARAADFGYMIWDGKSPGTLLNILRLVRSGKKAVLLNPVSNETKNFKHINDWNKFISLAEPSLVQDLRARATPEEWSDDTLPHQRTFLSVAEGAVSQSTIDESALDTINQALAAKDTGAAIQTLGTIAKQHGMSDLARTCGVARESLYRSLSSDGNPELVTFLSVLQAMGLKMTIGKVR